jgi:hypothetical protein
LIKQTHDRRERNFSKRADEQIGLMPKLAHEKAVLHRAFQFYFK